MNYRLSLFNKKALLLLAMVVFCYIAAFLKLPFTFVILFVVLCYTALIFSGAVIYRYVLPDEVYKRYSKHQIRFHLILAGLMILFLVGRRVISHYYMVDSHSQVRISVKALFFIIMFFLGRTFLIKGWTKRIWICFIIYCLVVVYPVFKTTNKISSAKINEKDSFKALQTLGYATWIPMVESAEKSGVTIYDPETSCEGFNMYSSLKSKLLIDMKGNVLHSWTLNESDGYEGFGYAELLEDGDLLAIASEGKGLVRLGWDSEIKWKNEILGHHDLCVADNGDIYILTLDSTVVFFGGVPFPTLEDHIVVISSNGKIKDNIPLYPVYKKHLSFETILRIYKQIIDPKRLMKMASHKLSGKQLLEDIHEDIWFSHTNTIELINEDIDGVCNKGDILLSSRNMCLIGILNVKRQEFVWTWGPGEIFGQHHPTLLLNGNIMLLDNGWTSRKYSRIIELDPITKEIKWEYHADPKEDFYTHSRGVNQRLPNGNTLITESDRGRAFEITEDGKIVWEFYNPNIKEERQERAAVSCMTRITDIENYPVLQALASGP